MINKFRNMLNSRVRRPMEGKSRVNGRLFKCFKSIRIPWSVDCKYPPLIPPVYFAYLMWARGICKVCEIWAWLKKLRARFRLSYLTIGMLNRVSSFRVTQVVYKIPITYVVIICYSASCKYYFTNSNVADNDRKKNRKKVQTTKLKLKMFTWHETIAEKSIDSDQWSVPVLVQKRVKNLTITQYIIFS